MADAIRAAGAKVVFGGPHVTEVFRAATEPGSNSLQSEWSAIECRRLFEFRFSAVQSHPIGSAFLLTDPILLCPLVASDAMICLFPFLPGQIRVLFKIFEKSGLGLPCYPC